MKTAMIISHEGRTAREVAIGPKQAKHWLDTANIRNRHILPKQVAKYARAMTEGRWRPLIGEPISFAEDGTLLNGQQRLTAVVESGTTQVFLVLEGLPLEDQDAMDAGSVRKRGQQLTIHGWKNGDKVSAIVSILLRWRTGTLLSGIYQPDTDEIVKFAEANRALVDASTVAALRIRRTVPLLPSVLGAVYFAAREMAVQQPEILQSSWVDAFFESLETGAALDAKSPILALRNHAARRKLASMRVEPDRELYYLCRVWNACRNGETMERLQLPREGPITQRHITLT